jgi:hypothetical protein
MKVYQRRVVDWLRRSFGDATTDDLRERRLRFLEEALELHQACGGTVGELSTLAAHVHDRPAGEPGQEIGGVVLCLAALATAVGVDVETAMTNEIERVELRTDEVRAKHAAKPLAIRSIV